MKIAVALFPTADAPAPGTLARMAEERGLESLWFAEHSHRPIGTAPPGAGERYAKAMDPFVAMTAAAVVTSTLKVATGVSLVPQRDPFHTAKQVASLDVLSGGRVIFGVGAGWNRQEMINHGTDPRTRMRLMTERMHAMIELWTKDEAEYHGEFVDFGPVHAWPKPLQVPHPPVVVGGDGPTVEDRIIAFGDGWVPDVSGVEDIVFERFERLRERTDKPLELTANGPSPDRETLSRLRDRGAHRALLRLPQHADGALSDGDAERFLDQVVAAASEEG
ncbi:MAG: LLM class F420-dependent oxidoreductase [Actinobacteria bacterium]|nr:LLM class F420-dependent oxidoreductase [Actinomycetota bacterium]